MAILVNMVTYGFIIYSHIEFKFLNCNAMLNSIKSEYLDNFSIKMYKLLIAAILKEQHTIEGNTNNEREKMSQWD